MFGKNGLISLGRPLVQFIQGCQTDLRIGSALSRWGFGSQTYFWDRTYRIPRFLGQLLCPNIFSGADLSPKPFGEGQKTGSACVIGAMHSLAPLPILHYIHWRRTKVETTGATQDYETLILRLFETILDFETKKQVVPWHQWYHLVRSHC